MTFKIETYRHGDATILHLIGRIQGEDVRELECLMLSIGTNVALDLEEVTLVDAEVIEFLGSCAARAITLIRCPPYIAEWIAKDKGNPEWLRQQSQTRRSL